MIRLNILLARSTEHPWWHHLLRRTAIVVATSLVLIDCARTWWHVEAFAPPLFDLDTDRGLAETFGYSYLSLAIVALIVSWRRHERSPIYAACASVFFVVIADDALEIHERLGSALAEAAGWGPIAGLGPPTLGAWTVWVIIGFCLSPLLVRAWRASKAEARQGAANIFGWFLLMLFAAVVIDGLRPMVGPYGLEWPDTFGYVLKLLEFSGELTAMVGIALVSLRIATAPPSPTVSDSETSATTGIGTTASAF